MGNEMFKKFLLRLRGFLNQPVEKQLMFLILIVFLIFLLTLTKYVSVLTDAMTKAQLVSVQFIIV